MMQPKKALIFFIAAFFFLLCAFSAGSLEIGGIFQLGTLGFQPDRVETDTTFSGADFLYGGSTYLRIDVAERFQVEAGFERDLVLRNVIYTLLQYRMDYFSLGIGMFLGLLDSGGSTLNSGISTSLSLELPGVAFVSLRSDNSLADSLSESGDFSQQRIDLSVGFYVKNAICSLNLTTKKYAELKSYEIIDRLTRYSFKADIYQKNIPFRLVLSFAYQMLGKKYLDATNVPPNPNHGLNSLLLGTELDLVLGPRLLLMLGIESNLFSFGSGELAGDTIVGFNPYLFQAYTGFRLNFPRAARKDRQEL
jgi:hypothetical protein